MEYNFLSNDLMRFVWCGFLFTTVIMNSANKYKNYLHEKNR